MPSKKNAKNDGPYVSPKELAERWRCSRSSVDRIAQYTGSPSNWAPREQPYTGTTPVRTRS